MYWHAGAKVLQHLCRDALTERDRLLHLQPAHPGGKIAWVKGIACKTPTLKPITLRGKFHHILADGDHFGVGKP
jgi:hypothetical protein